MNENRPDGADCVCGADRVHLKRRQDRLGRVFADATVEDRAGIVDEHVDATEVLLGSQRQPGGMFGISDVCGKHKLWGAELRGGLRKIR